MRLVFFLMGIIFLGIIIVPMQNFADAGATYLATIPGIEEWIVTGYSMIPIIIPAGIAIVLLMFVIKGKNKQNVE